MDTLLALYEDLQQVGNRFYTWDLGDRKAVTIEFGERYGIFMDFSNIHTTAEERMVVAHEGGHAVTGATHKVCSPFDLIEKHECRANRWAYKKLIHKDKLDEAVTLGYTEPWELAEYFNVSEPFLLNAIQYFQLMDKSQ